MYWYNMYISLLCCVALTSAISVRKSTEQETKSQAFDHAMPMYTPSMKEENSEMTKEATSAPHQKPSGAKDQPLKVIFSTPLPLPSAAASDNNTPLSAMLMPSSQEASTAATTNAISKSSTARLSASKTKFTICKNDKKKNQKPTNEVTKIIAMENTTSTDNVSTIEKTISTKNTSCMEKPTFIELTNSEVNSTTNISTTHMVPIDEDNTGGNRSYQHMQTPKREDRNSRLGSLFKMISKGISLSWFVRLNRGGIGINTGGADGPIYKIMEDSGEDLIKNL